MALGPLAAVKGSGPWAPVPWSVYEMVLSWLYRKSYGYFYQLVVHFLGVLIIRALVFESI